MPWHTRSSWRSGTPPQSLTRLSSHRRLSWNSKTCRALQVSHNLNLYLTKLKIIFFVAGLITQSSLPLPELSATDKSLTPPVTPLLHGRKPDPLSKQVLLMKATSVPQSVNPDPCQLRQSPEPPEVTCQVDDLTVRRRCQLSPKSSSVPPLSTEQATSLDYDPLTGGSSSPCSGEPNKY